jgi:hypothetical protein
VTPEQANTLAHTMTGSWPRHGVAHDTWAAKFGPLDYDDVLAVIGRLVDTTDQPPSVAQFIATHRAHVTPTRIRHMEPCAICDGLGWESITVHRPNHPYPTSGVIPCRCSNGRNVRDAHQRAVDANDTELRRRPPATETAA